MGIIIIMLTKKGNDRRNKCNCRVRNSCPLDEICLRKSVIYKKEVIEINQLGKVYIESTIDFKITYRGHMSCFPIKPQKKNATALATYFNRLSAKNRDFRIGIIAESSPYKGSSSKRGLCTKEANYILRTSFN